MKNVNVKNKILKDKSSEIINVLKKILFQAINLPYYSPSRMISDAYLQVICFFDP